MSDQFRPFDFAIEQLAQGTQATTQGIQQRGRDARESRQQGQGEMMKTIREGDQAAAHLDPNDPEDAEALEAWEAFKAANLGQAKQAPGFDVPDIAMDFAGGQPVSDLKRRALLAQKEPPDMSGITEEARNVRDNLREQQQALIDSLENLDSPNERAMVREQIAEVGNVLGTHFIADPASGQAFLREADRLQRGRPTQRSEGRPPGDLPPPGEGLDISQPGIYGEVSGRGSPGETLGQARGAIGEEQRRGEALEQVRTRQFGQIEESKGLIARYLGDFEEALPGIEANDPDRATEVQSAIDDFSALEAEPVGTLSRASDWNQRFAETVNSLPREMRPEALVARANALAAEAQQEEELQGFQVEQAQSLKDTIASDLDALLETLDSEVEDEEARARAREIIEPMSRFARRSFTEPGEAGPFIEEVRAELDKLPQEARTLAADFLGLQVEERTRRAQFDTWEQSLWAIAEDDGRDDENKVAAIEEILEGVEPEFLSERAGTLDFILQRAGVDDPLAVRQNYAEGTLAELRVDRERTNLKIEQTWGPRMAQLDYETAQQELDDLRFDSANERRDSFIATGLGLDDLSDVQVQALIEGMPGIHSRTQLHKWGRERFDMWQRAEEAEVTNKTMESQRLQGVLDGQAADRMEDVMETGVGVQHLTSEQRQELIDRLPEVNNEQGLDRWATERFQMWNDSKQAALEYEESRNENLKVNIKRGRQEIEHSAAAEDRASWRFERERALVPFEDAEREQGWVDRIGLATHNGESALLASYLSAFDNDGSALGQQLRQTFTRAELERKYEQAKETRQLQERQLIANTEYTETLSEEAAGRLEKAQALDPLEIEAMRVQYQVDRGQAENALANLAMDNTINQAEGLADLAKVVGPDFWDDLEDNPAKAPLLAAMQASGLNPSTFRAMSRAETYMREEPLREEAWQSFQFYLEAPPSADQRPAAREAAGEALEQAGVTDPRSRESMLNILEGSWDMQESSEQRALLNTLATISSMQAQQESVEREQWIELLSELNRHGDNMRQQQDAALQNMTLEGCGMAVPLGANSYIMLADITDEDTGEVKEAISGRPCDEVAADAETGWETYIDTIQDAETIIDRMRQDVLPTLEGEPEPEPEPEPEGDAGATQPRREQPSSDRHPADVAGRLGDVITADFGRELTGEAKTLLEEWMALPDQGLTQQQRNRGNAILDRLEEVYNPEVAAALINEWQKLAQEGLLPGQGP